ncbi:hypothetical protein X975_17869, partial [Stegodyphus mimosarum]
MDEVAPLSTDNMPETTASVEENAMFKFIMDNSLDIHDPKNLRKVEKLDFSQIKLLDTPRVDQVLTRLGQWVKLLYAQADHFTTAAKFHSEQLGQSFDFMYDFATRFKEAASIIEGECAIILANKFNVPVTNLSHNKRKSSIIDLSDDANEGFKKPAKTAKSKRIAKASPPIPLKNKFDSLNNDVNIAHVSSENLNTDSTNDCDAMNVEADPDSNSASEDKQLQPPDFRKPPPIMVKPVQGITYYEFLKMLAEKISESKFYGRLNGEFLKVEPTTPDDHRILSKYFLDNSIEHYLINPRHSKPIKVLLRGLPSDSKVETITESLKELGYKVHKVVQLTKYKTKAPMPLFQAQLFPSSKVDSIYDLTHRMQKVQKTTSEQVAAVNITMGSSRKDTSMKYTHSPPHPDQSGILELLGVMKEVESHFGYNLSKIISIYKSKIPELKKCEHILDKIQILHLILEEIQQLDDKSTP